MKKFLSTLCVGALAGAMSITSFSPSLAMPAASSPIVDRTSDVTPVQLTERELRRLRRENREDRRFERRVDRLERRQERRAERRQDRREARREAFERRNGGYYYRGYRGYRDARPGYRYYNGYYFPAAAFIAGAIITGAIANSQPRVVVRSGSAHTDWCYNRYRSYRASDNTFQPNSGPRRECVSPY